VEEETRQFDVGVPQAVDDRNAVPFENLSRLRGGLVRDQQNRSVRVRVGVLDELPSSGGVRALLRLNGHAGASAGEAKNGVHTAIPPAGLAGDRGDPWDLPQDAERVRFERRLYLHEFGLIHNGCEYITRREGKLDAEASLPLPRRWRAPEQAGSGGRSGDRQYPL
jgi:hypothetical protein